MMILPLADVLQNCLQNLTSRIAGMNNEQMSNRVMGMGTMLGFGMGAIKEQFKSPVEKIKNPNNTDNNSSGGFKGFVSRAKSVISPSMNLSAEKDYNGNINPIRDVLPKEKTTNATTYNTNTNTNTNENDNKNTNENDNKNTNENSSNNSANKTTFKSVAGKVAKTGFKATKAYLEVGAKMAEGDFTNNYKYNTNKNSINNSLKNNTPQDTEYINKIAENDESENNSDKKSGDLNEHKE